MVQSRLRAALGLALVLSRSAPALAQQPGPGPDTPYQRLVDRYAGGDHVAAVLELVKLRFLDLTKEAVDALEAHSKQYQQGLVSEQRTGGVEADALQAYLRGVRAVAALHLEAAVAVPPDSYGTRHRQLTIAQAALRLLEVERARPWSRDAATDAAVRAENARFRRDWFLIGVTHFQRIGAVSDALAFVERALEEFRDDGAFHVIEGSIYEALASPIAIFDSARVTAGLPQDRDQAARAALRRAWRSFERALVVQPDDAEARVRLARVLVLLGEFDAAKGYLAADAPPGRLAYLLTLARGHAAEAQRRYDVAVGFYREAAAMPEHWQSACMALAHALVKQGHREEARQGLRACVADGPAANDPWPAYPMGLEWLVAPTVRQLRVRVSGGTSARHD